MNRSGKVLAYSFSERQVMFVRAEYLEQEVQIPNPTYDVIQYIVNKIHENGGYLILEASTETNSFMQASSDPGSTFGVEYRDGTADDGTMERQYQSIDDVPVETTLELFRLYLLGDFSWASLVTWSEIEEQAYKIPTSRDPLPQSPEPNETPSGSLGVVYLLKAGPFYKIGKAIDFERRLGQIKLQLPYPVEVIHTIKTDDISGIEHYWHKRFVDKRTNGEWFVLTDSDVVNCTDDLFFPAI